MIISPLCIINNDEASFRGRRRPRRVLQRSLRRRVAINFNLSLCSRLKSTRRLWQLSANRGRLSGREGGAGGVGSRCLGGDATPLYVVDAHVHQQHK